MFSLWRNQAPSLHYILHKLHSPYFQAHLADLEQARLLQTNFKQIDVLDIFLVLCTEMVGVDVFDHVDEANLGELEIWAKLNVAELQRMLDAASSGRVVYAC